MRERVVQIESDCADLGQAQIAVHEHAVPAWNPVLAIAQGPYGWFVLGRGALRGGHSGIVGDLTALRPLSTVPG